MNLKLVGLWSLFSKGQSTYPPMFIKRFMNCAWASSLFDKTYWILSCNNDDIIVELNNIYVNDREDIKYSHDQMY